MESRSFLKNCLVASWADEDVVELLFPSAEFQKIVGRRVRLRKDPVLIRSDNVEAQEEEGGSVLVMASLGWVCEQHWGYSIVILFRGVPFVRHNLIFIIFALTLRVQDLSFCCFNICWFALESSRNIFLRYHKN